MRIWVCFLVMAMGLSAGEPGEEIRLWPGAAPGSEGVKGEEVSERAPGAKLAKRYTVVHQPSIFVFLPEKAKANGTAMIIAPGGGHSQLVIEKEGWDIAKWCNERGIAAFVLKYRLSRAPGVPYQWEKEALADATRAVRMVRSRAGEWGVNPGKIGFMGFSAGGAVAAILESKFSGAEAGAADAIDRVSGRPDFNVIVYPGWRAGQVPAPPKEAPAAFLVCADNDPSHVVTTVEYYLALQKAGVSAEMHIYADGAHGFGMKETKLPVAKWPERLEEWMVDRKFLGR